MIMRSFYLPCLLVTGLTLAACGQGNEATSNESANAIAAGSSADASTTALNEVAPQSRPPSGTEFKSVLSLNQEPGPGEPQLRGGADR